MHIGSFPNRTSIDPFHTSALDAELGPVVTGAVGQTIHFKIMIATVAINGDVVQIRLTNRAHEVVRVPSVATR
jgi:hypothetical protein